MYKRKFPIWGWKRYQKVKGYATPDRVLYTTGAVKRSGRRRNAAPPTMSPEDIAGLDSRRPPSSNGAIFQPARFRPRISAHINLEPIDRYFDSILFNVKNLFINSIDEKIWKVFDNNVVEEDIHDDLLVGVAMALRNYTSLGTDIGFEGIKKAFRTLEKVVADCGPFSLPAIWESYLRMIRKGRGEFANSFLLQALKLAIKRFGYNSKVQNHPFVEALVGLWNIEKMVKTDRAQLEHVIFRAYRSCIEHTKEKLGPDNLTALCLWGDFVVYLDGSSTNETQAVVQSIRRGVECAELEHGWDGDHTIELLGLTLYVLQSDPTMAEEAEKVALDMLPRINQRQEKAGGTLEEDLRIKSKDLKHTLGTFRKEKEDYKMAISFLQDFFHEEVEDERDTLALQMLEECYEKLGEQAAARTVRQRRMDSSHTLLREDRAEQSELTVSVGSQKKDEVTSVSAFADDDIERSEGTIADDESRGDEEAIENEGNDKSDAEAEIQIVEEQISQLQQRLNDLKKKVKG